MGPKKDYGKDIKEGDCLWAQDGKKLFPAKVLKISNYKGILKFYVHYQGWNRKWDSWIDAEFVKKNDKDNDQSVKARHSGVAIETEEDPTRKRKKPSDDGDDDDNYNVEKQISMKEALENAKRRAKELLETDCVDYPNLPKRGFHVNMPFSMKRQIVHDWEAVAKSPHKLLPLPRPLPLSKIIANFLLLKKEEADDEQYKTYDELFQSLMKYFDEALPKVLLYRWERKQYTAHMMSQHNESVKKISLSTIYGVEHLLRLFVKLPFYMSGLVITSGEQQKMQAKFNELLRYIQKEKLVSSTAYTSEEEVMIAYR